MIGNSACVLSRVRCMTKTLPSWVAFPGMPDCSPMRLTSRCSAYMLCCGSSPQRAVSPQPRTHCFAGDRSPVRHPRKPRRGHVARTRLGYAIDALAVGQVFLSLFLRTPRLHRNLPVVRSRTPVALWFCLPTAPGPITARRRSSACVRSCMTPLSKQSRNSSDEAHIAANRNCTLQ